jgi:hypothetical protein
MIFWNEESQFKKKRRIVEGSSGVDKQAMFK